METVSVLKRQTQTARYWAEDFRIGQDDIDHIYTILLEREAPLSTDELALALVRYRVQKDEEELSRRLTRSNIYQPKDAYEAGAEITFPALDFTTGKVVGKRPGENPEYGHFQVIQVEMASGETREFASELQGDHALNVDEAELAAQQESLLTPEEIFIEYGGDVADTIEEQPRRSGLAGRAMVPQVAAGGGPCRPPQSRRGCSGYGGRRANEHAGHPGTDRHA
jgi:hypothetical protein